MPLYQWQALLRRAPDLLNEDTLRQIAAASFPHLTKPAQNRLRAMLRGSETVEKKRAKPQITKDEFRARAALLGITVQSTDDGTTSRRS